MTNHRPGFGTYRDGRAHGHSRTDTERTAEWTEWRGRPVGDGKVPLRVFGQGLSLLIASPLGAVRWFGGGRERLPKWSLTVNEVRRHQVHLCCWRIQARAVHP